MIEGNRHILSSRHQPLKAQAQRRRVAALRQLDRLAGDLLGFAVQERLHGERGLVARAFRAASVARLKGPAPRSRRVVSRDRTGTLHEIAAPAFIVH
jgi:hypothetical protein